MNLGKRALRAAWGFCLATSVAACAHHGGGHGHEHGGHHQRGVITVTGAGEARAAPNLARTSIGIEVRAPSVQEAMQQANAQVAQLTQALKQQGIADGDLRTNGFSVSYDREYHPPQPVMSMEAPKEAAARPAAARKGAPAVESAPAPDSAPAAPAPRGSYVVNNQLEVTIRDVGKLGSVLSAATSSGANNIWGINFDIEDKRPLIEKARAEAFEHAKADAERIAALSGVKLGKLLRVADGAGGGPVMPMYRERAQMAADSAVPVQAGQLTVSHQVELEYEIARE